MLHVVEWSGCNFFFPPCWRHGMARRAICVSGDSIKNMAPRWRMISPNGVLLDFFCRPFFGSRSAHLTAPYDHHYKHTLCGHIQGDALYLYHGRHHCALVWSNSSDWPPRNTKTANEMIWMMTTWALRRQRMSRSLSTTTLRPPL